MAYMVYQQLITAIRDAYRSNPAAADHMETAISYRDWLQSLEVDRELRDQLVEQAAAIAEAFRSAAGSPR